MSDAALLVRMKDDVKVAMKARESKRVEAIRLLLASLENKRIDAHDDLTDDAIIAVLTTEAKKRREAAKAFHDGNRTELAEQEEFELGVIQTYLPEPLSDEEVERLVDEAIAATGASSKAEMGKVMGKVMGQVKGRYDGSKLKDVVMGKLA